MSYYRGDNYSTNMDEASTHPNAMDEASYYSSMEFASEDAPNHQPTGEDEKDELYTEIRNIIIPLIERTGFSYEEIKTNENVQRVLSGGRDKHYHTGKWHWLFPGKLDQFSSGDILNALKVLDRKVAKKNKEERVQHYVQQQPYYPAALTPPRRNGNPSYSPSQQSPVLYGAASTPPRYPEQSRRNANAVPQPSPHHEQQQYPGHHDQLVQHQNNNSPDAMSYGGGNDYSPDEMSAYTQRSIADVSMASAYTQGSNINPHQRFVSGAAQRSSRRNQSSLLNRSPRLSPKRLDRISSTSQRLEMASTNSRNARKDQYSARRQMPDGALLLVAHLEQYAGRKLNEAQVDEISDMFIDQVDVTRGMPSSLEFDNLKDLVGLIRKDSNVADEYEALDDKLTGYWFTSVIR